MYVLCVDDNATDLDFVTRVLRTPGHEVITFETASDALRCAQTRPPDVLLTDFKLPGANGLHLAREVRQMYPACVIVVMSSYFEMAHAVTALRLGVDDLIIKPLPLDLADVLWGAVLRHQAGRRSLLVNTVGSLYLDRAQRTVKWHGREVYLTKGEFAILDALSSKPGQVISFIDLYWMATGVRLPHAKARNLLKQHILNLRHKLGEAQDGCAHLISVRGEGYRWHPQGELTYDAVDDRRRQK
jgi:DNA-binding response OmpR family regulator